MNTLVKIFLLIGLVGQVVAQAREDRMQEVLKIAHGISVVQPHLSDAEYISYAIGIYRAARRYGIHPAVLVSITQQESGFRPNLPEGPAGEIGICQIIKSWLKNPRFISHFGTMTVKDLKKPATSFRVAAWILSELRDSTLSGPLPFWSFYNSRLFKNRLKYFVRVTQKLKALRKHAPSIYSASLMKAASQARTKTLQPGVRTVAALQSVGRVLIPKHVKGKSRLRAPLIQTASLGSELGLKKTVND